MKCLAILFLLLLAVHSFAQSIPEKMQQGLARFESGDLDAATTLFQQVIQQNPEHGPARLLLGQIFLQRRQLEEAEEHLKVATRSNPRRLHLAWQLLGKVQALRKNYADAGLSLERSLELSPSDATEIFETKLLLDALKDDAGTMNRLRVAVGENLGKSEAYSALGIRLVRSGDPKAALPLFQIASQINSRNALAHFFLEKKETGDSRDIDVAEAISNANKGLAEANLGEAARIAKELLAERPMYVPAHLILIEVAERKREYWDALAEYRTLLQWMSGVPAIHSRHALLARDLQAYELAECSTRKALEVQPEDGSLHYLLATILWKRGKTDEAIEGCQKSIQLGFNKAEVYVTLGDLYYEKMSISESIAALGKGVELDPRAAESIASFALSALTTADYQALRTLLEKHVVANPESVNTLYSLGIMNSNEGKTEEAKQYFLKLARLKPDSSQVQYNLALIYSREGDQAKAAEALAKFHELKAKEQMDWLKYSEAHKMRHEATEAIKTGKPQRALEIYQKLADNGTAEKGDLLAAGQACQRLRDQACAYSWYEKVLKIAPYDKKGIEGLASTAEALGKKDISSLNHSRAQLLSSSC